MAARVRRVGVSREVISNVTKPEVFTGNLELRGDSLTGEVSTAAQMTDFGFNTPGMMMFQTENKILLDLQFTGHPVAG